MRHRICLNLLTWHPRQHFLLARSWPPRLAATLLLFRISIHVNVLRIAKRESSCIRKISGKRFCRRGPQSWCFKLTWKLLPFDSCRSDVLDFFHSCMAGSERWQRWSHAWRGNNSALHRSNQFVILATVCHDNTAPLSYVSFLSSFLIPPSGNLPREWTRTQSHDK